MSRKVLVTGGAGFIGSHLVDGLLEAGHQVVCLDNLRNGRIENLADARQNPAFTLLTGDILDADTCRQATAGCDTVFHLACLGVRHSLHSPFENHRVNAEGTLNVLEAARAERVKGFYYISTSEVYGETDRFPITEEAPTRPTTVYGASKLAGEHYTLAYRKVSGLPACVIRLFNNYGPRAHHEGDCGEIIPRAIVRALYGQKPFLMGDGSVTRDFLFVRDTVNALIRLMALPVSDIGTLNVGAGTEIRMKELLEKVLRAAGKSELGIEQLDARPADVPRLWVDPARFRSLAGNLPLTDFDKGLGLTVDYYRHEARTRKLIENVQECNWK